VGLIIITINISISITALLYSYFIGVVLFLGDKVLLLITVLC